MSHSSSLQELNALLIEDPHPVNDRFNAEALEPFTDTLFYDWDSGRILEGGPDEHNAEAPLETSHENPNLVGGVVNPLNDPTSTSTLSSDPYTFAECKFPREQHQPVQQSSPIIAPHSMDVGISPHALTSPATTSPPNGDMDQQSFTAYAFPLLDLSSPGAEGATASPNSAASPSGSLSPLGAADTVHILAIQESARLAAEEDKRRRNTAASARFRVKKKQRDQELERKTKEMADKVHDLEKKVGQLELENRWLRNLLMEKNTVGQTREERAKDGVGTAN